MLNFSAGRSVAGHGVLTGFLSQDCVLCGEGGDALVCGDCEASLPRARAACLRCANPLPSPGYCGHCLARPPAFDETLALFEYRFPLDRLVQRFKYAGDLAVGGWLARRLAKMLHGAMSPQVLVCPPSTSERLRSRGFNPALEIAKSVARDRGIDCAIEGIVRVRDTPPQPGLGRIARQRNIEGALRCALEVDGMHVALVDDVMTTGATANAAARLLKKAGAARVSVWVVARTPDPHFAGGRADV